MQKYLCCLFTCQLRLNRSNKNWQINCLYRGFYILYTFSVMAKISPELGDVVAHDGGDVKPSIRSVSQVQLAEHIYRYLEADFQLESGS